MPSIQEQLKAKRQTALAKEIRLPVPGWEDESLIAVFRPVQGWGEVRDFLVTEDPKKELDVAAQTLVSHCTGTEAHLEGEVHQMVKLGKQLADSLDIDGAENDQEAIFLLLPSQEAVIALYGLLRRESGRLIKDAQEEMRGESTAS